MKRHMKDDFDGKKGSEIDVKKCTDCVAELEVEMTKMMITAAGLGKKLESGNKSVGNLAGKKYGLRARVGADST